VFESKTKDRGCPIRRLEGTEGVVEVNVYITNKMQLIQCSLLLSALHMFWEVFPPIIRSL